MPELPAPRPLPPAELGSERIVYEKARPAPRPSSPAMAAPVVLNDEHTDAIRRFPER